MASPNTPSTIEHNRRVVRAYPDTLSQAWARPKTDNPGSLTPSLEGARATSTLMLISKKTCAPTSAPDGTSHNIVRRSPSLPTRTRFGERPSPFEGADSASRITCWQSHDPGGSWSNRVRTPGPGHRAKSFSQRPALVRTLLPFTPYPWVV